MVRPRVLISFVLSLAAALAAADDGLGAWVASHAQAAGFAPARGPWTWRIGWATGNLAADPALALAERRALDDALAAAGAPGDKVGTFGFEMAPWGAKPEGALGDEPGRALDGLPTTPAADSRGGRDVERALLAGATAAPGAVVLVMSPGPSQAPMKGASPKGEADPAFLKEIARLGYRAPERFTAKVDVAGSPRTLMASLLLPLTPPEATGGRAPFPKREAKPPAPGPKTVVTTQSNGWIVPTVLAGLLGLAAGLLLGRRATPEPEPIDIDDATLDAWREEATRLRRALDLVAQDLGETSEGLKTDLLAAGEARQEAHRLKKGLESWDETAIDYLDAARRAAEMDGLSPERRETWAKAARDFARLTRARGLDAIAPEPGEPFVDGLHRAESVVEDPTAGAGRIVECLSWGFRRGDAVIRPAAVVLALPSR